MNQYGFGDADPVGNSDPFGLKVCFNSKHRALLVEATKRATNSDFEVDETTGCVIESTVVHHGGREWTELQAAFMRRVRSATQWDVFATIDKPSSVSGYTVFINPLDAVLGAYPNGNDWVPYGGEIGASVAHELLGHGEDGWLRVLSGVASTNVREKNGLRYENLFLKAIGKPERTRYDFRCAVKHGCPPYFPK